MPLVGPSLEVLKADAEAAVNRSFSAGVAPNPRHAHKATVARDYLVHGITSQALAREAQMRGTTVDELAQLITRMSEIEANRDADRVDLVLAIRAAASHAAVLEILNRRGITLRLG